MGRGSLAITEDPLVFLKVFPLVSITDHWFNHWSVAQGLRHHMRASGDGVDAADREHIFFYRSGASTWCID